MGKVGRYGWFGLASSIASKDSNRRRIPESCESRESTFEFIYPNRRLSQRSPPAPPKKQSTQYSPNTNPLAYRPAPSPPTTLGPSLDRSTSQRTPSKPSKPSNSLGRANTTRDRQPLANAPPSSGGYASANQKKPSPGSSSSDLPLKQQQQQLSQSNSIREAREREARAQTHQPSPAATSLAKAASSGSGVATPRRREKKEKDKDKEMDIVKRLQQICTDADPTKLYRNLVKIGQGLVYFISSCVLWMSKSPL